MTVILKGLVLLLAGVFVLLCPPLSLLAVACARWDQDPTPDQWGTTPTRRGDLPRWAHWMQTMDERLPGGWIADRFVGQRNAVVAGAVLMSAGHFAMAFDQSFLVALALLILGSGLLKGNISAQVGGLYSIDDEANRVRAYTVFSMAINVGAVLGPIVCGLLAQLYGWHTGFGAAALFIMIGLVTYLAGYRHLPARAVRAASVSRALTSAEWRRIRAICAVLAIVVRVWRTGLEIIPGVITLGVTSLLERERNLKA